MSRQDDIDYDRQADEMRAENVVLLEGFETWLEDSGLKEKTVRKHLGNVSFYIDDYLPSNCPRRLPPACRPGR